MVTGTTPFNGSTKEELFQQILTENIKLPGYLSQDLRSLLSQLLERDPQKRLCSEDAIMSQRWFKGVEWDKLSEMPAPMVPKLESVYDLKYSGQEFEHEDCNGIEVEGLEHWEDISDSDE
jgi:serum/glucocorticoid-regulated kinase 2